MFGLCFKKYDGLQKQRGFALDWQVTDPHNIESLNAFKS